MRLCRLYISLMKILPAIEYLFNMQFPLRQSKKGLILEPLTYTERTQKHTLPQPRQYWKEGDDSSASFHLFIRPDITPHVASPACLFTSSSFHAFPLNTLSLCSFVASFLLLSFISASWHRSFFLHTVSLCCCPSSCIALNYLVSFSSSSFDLFSFKS